MVSVICDACKKPIPEAQREINYFSILDKNLCYTCKEKLDNTVKEKMAQRPRYIFKEYKKILAQTVKEMCE